MESESKKQKLDDDCVTVNFTESLTSICDWNRLQAVAIKHHEDAQTSVEISYSELAGAKLRVEKILRDSGTSVFIGIAFDVPSYCLPALMLGIISTDRAFVCLPSSTTETQRICDKLRVSHIFSSDNTSGLSTILQCEIHCKRLFLLRSNNLFSDLKKSEVEKQIFAYAMTTSGSTGEPKIVRVTHPSIVPNVLDLKKILMASELDTIAQMTPATFDPSIIEIFLSLSCGASLFTVSQKLKNESESLLAAMVKSGVTVLQTTPSLLTQRWSSEELRRTILGEDNYLRILMLGGENFPTPEALTRIKAPGNGTRIFDVYGVTEVSCWACIREILPDDRSRILGKSLSQTIIEVRDSEGNVVEKGEGIVHIGSNTRICVIDDEEIVPSRVSIFRNTGDTVEIDEDGRMTLKGRIDRRAKRYGIRMNPTELELQVTKLPFVKNCHVLFVEKNQSLHLFFTIIDDHFNDETKQRYETIVHDLAKDFSHVHRPDKIYLIERFELNSNGKLCTSFLTKIAVESSTILDVTKILGEKKSMEIFENIWNESLSYNRNSGFLDLGGTSIIAMRIANEISNETGRQFPELIGRLLRNDNFESCRSYVSSRCRNCLEKQIQSQIQNQKTIQRNDSKESIESIDRMIRPNMDDKFGFDEQFSIPETSNNSTNTDIVMAWQKCRGRNDFPMEIEEKNLNLWKTVGKIRLMKRYFMKKCVDASPTIFSYNGDKNYVSVGSHSGIICTAELSKKIDNDYWEIELPDRIEASVLVLDEFKAVVGTYDGYVYCLHLKTGIIFWKFKTGDAVKCTAVHCSRKRNLFFGSYDRHAYCVSSKNGSEVWKAKTGNGSISATPCVSDELDCVVFAMLDGTCACLKQTNGRIDWRNKLDYPIFSAPVILKNKVVAVCDVAGYLTGFLASTGDKIWTVKIDGAVFSHLTTNNDLLTRSHCLIVASKNGKIYKYDFSSIDESPILRFVEDCGAPVFSTPWSNGNIIVVVGTDGRLRIIDGVNGKLLNLYKIDGDVFSSPIVHEDFIVVGCRDDYLYVLTCTEDDS